MRNKIQAIIVIFIIILFISITGYGYNAGETRIIGGVEFVWIPSGNFIMGSSKEDAVFKDEMPQHTVQISGFWMGKYEVTQSQWKDIMGMTIRQVIEKGNTDWPILGEGENYPIYYLGQNEVKDFCKKLSKKYGVKCRLPYEAEWEYACRAGTQTKYYWGNETNGDYYWNVKNSDDQIHPVGQKKPNLWGLYDMSGNVWEWCEDLYDPKYYSRSPAKNPKGPKTSYFPFVLRGGSCAWSYGDFFRCAYRGINHSNDITDIRYGFRIVVEEK